MRFYCGDITTFQWIHAIHGHIFMRHCGNYTIGHVRVILKEETTAHNEIKTVFLKYNLHVGYTTYNKCDHQGSIKSNVMTHSNAIDIYVQLQDCSIPIVNAYTTPKVCAKP